MPWWDWAKEVAGKVVKAIEEGLKELIELPEEIRPEVLARPASVEELIEIVEETPYAERFIQEEVLDEARNLSRGVRFYEPLKNVARLRHWTVQTPEQIPPSPDYQISVRRVVVGPDGRMTFVDVALPTNVAYTEDEIIRRAASALEEDFASGYTLGRSDIIRRYTVAQDVYIQRYKPL